MRDLARFRDDGGDLDDVWTEEPLGHGSGTLDRVFIGELIEH